MIYTAATSNESGYSITSQNFFRNFFEKIEPPNKQSISESRQKLKWQAFEYLLTEIYNESSPRPSWKGHSVKVIDGTTVTLPRTKELLEVFEPASNQLGFSHYPKGLLVTAMDLGTGQPVAAKFDSIRRSERDMALEVLPHLKPNDIVLLDRGLGGSKVYYEMNEKQIFFVHRAHTNHKKSAWYVKGFLASRKKEDLVVIGYDGDPDKPILVRLIRGPKLKNGVMVLVTNLVDDKFYKAREILKLYKSRWEVETHFNRLKNILSMETIRSKKVNNIFQDVYAHLIVVSIAALLEFLGSKKYGMDRQKAICSFKNAINIIRRHFNLLFGLAKLTRHLLSNILHEITTIIWRKQPGRSYPRYSKQPQNTWIKAHA